MKGPLWMSVFSIFFTTTNGQCPQNEENSSVTSCDGSTNYGSYISIDSYKINRPCTCTLTSSFDGQLLILSKKAVESGCRTKVTVKNEFIFGCPLSTLISQTVNVIVSQTVNVRVEYVPTYSSGPFYHCIGFQQNGGLNGNFSVMCGYPSDTATTTATSTTIFTTTLNSTQLSHASSSIPSSREFTSVVNTSKKRDVTLSSTTINVSYDSLSIESTQDDPETLYRIAGSAGGGAIILVGLFVLILVLINRSRSARNKNRSTEADMARTNEVFDSNHELPDNPLYLSSQPMDELGYSSDQEKQLGLPPTDSKTKNKINSDYDVPPNNKPIDHGASSMPVYAFPKRGKDCTPSISTGDVYAEVCKPNRGTVQDPVRKRNGDGLLYMEVEQDTAATKQTNTNDKNEITEGVCYAEIKRT